jgi:hypothetical protein
MACVSVFAEICGRGRVEGMIADVKERRSNAGFSDTDWRAFDVEFASDVDALLKERVRATQTDLKITKAFSMPSLMRNESSLLSTPL